MDTSQKIEPRNIDDLYNAFENADYVISKRYRYSLANQPVCDIPNSIKNIEIGSNFQIFRILKLTYDKNENTLNKLTTVYHSLTANEDAGIIMFLISNGSTVELYCGTVCRDINENGKCATGKRSDQVNSLMSSFEANFPGMEYSKTKINSKTNQKEYFDKEKIIDKMIFNNCFISSVTGVAGLRNEKEAKNENFIQGMEKLIEAMHGKSFSALFIADCMSTSNIESICANYEDIYSQLSPFLQSQQTIGKTDGITDTESVIDGITNTTNKSVSESESKSHTKGTFSANSIGGSVGGGIGVVNASVNYNHSFGKNTSDTNTSGKTNTTGSAESLTKQNSTAKSITNSTNEGVQITYQNRAVKALMERIDEQIKRLRCCEDFGVFDFGAYFIADDMPTSQTAAAVYESLMRGENSSVETSAVNSWNREKSQQVGEYLKHIYHPQIAIPNLSQPLNNQANKAEEKMFEINSVMPTTLISGKELSIQMSLPKKSVNGIAVLECAEFGREVLKLSEDTEDSITLGNVSHMRKVYDTPLKINKDNLTAHTFITGSTGAGKSNTIYTMLDKLCLSDEKDVHFMVVEPAKGEYKDVLGGYDDVSVYGTNQNKTDMLYLNPFSFPNDIHVLEHIDRLVEIFNACWPMYAAMPAVLKDAIEMAYIKCGWSMTQSICSNKQFPTFKTVINILPEIINSSSYSDDTKGDYIGSLVTRIKSLTNGINGKIFCSDEEIQPENLFDKNVIVDLSRIGSVETKSLMMGILVMKLQEHRMANGGMNQCLKHITVLEEAHNLLRRTSSEQSQEGSNLQGKSVEMIANAIAEMRTYGEGFIIADQSPGLMDMSVIRNTNTKIIMRLPEESDRKLVGKAAGLNDEQIVEISKFGKGIAAVYQNDWLEPVLCKVNHFTQPKKYQFLKSEHDCSYIKEMFLNNIFSNTKDAHELTKEDADKIRLWIETLNTGVDIKKILLSALDNKIELDENDKSYVAYCLVKGKKMIETQLNNNVSVESVQSSIDAQITDVLNVSSKLSSIIRQLIFQYAANNTEINSDLHNNLLLYGGVK